MYIKINVIFISRSEDELCSSTGGRESGLPRSSTAPSLPPGLPPNDGATVISISDAPDTTEEAPFTITFRNVSEAPLSRAFNSEMTDASEPQQSVSGVATNPPQPRQRSNLTHSSSLCYSSGVEYSSPVGPHVTHYSSQDLISRDILTENLLTQNLLTHNLITHNILAKDVDSERRLEQSLLTNAIQTRERLAALADAPVAAAHSQVRYKQQYPTATLRRDKSAHKPTSSLQQQQHNLLKQQQQLLIQSQQKQQQQTADSKRQTSDLIQCVDSNSEISSTLFVQVDTDRTPSLEDTGPHHTDRVSSVKDVDRFVSSDDATVYQERQNISSSLNQQGFAELPNGTDLTNTSNKLSPSFLIDNSDLGGFGHRRSLIGSQSLDEDNREGVSNKQRIIPKQLSEVITDSGYLNQSYASPSLGHDRSTEVSSSYRAEVLANDRELCSSDKQAKSTSTTSIANGFYDVTRRNIEVQTDIVIADVKAASGITSSAIRETTQSGTQTLPFTDVTHTAYRNSSDSDYQDTCSPLHGSAIIPTTHLTKSEVTVGAAVATTSHSNNSSTTPPPQLNSNTSSSSSTLISNPSSASTIPCSASTSVIPASTITSSGAFTINSNGSTMIVAQVSPLSCPATSQLPCHLSVALPPLCFPATPLFPCHL